MIYEEKNRGHLTPPHSPQYIYWYLYNIIIVTASTQPQLKLRVTQLSVGPPTHNLSSKLEKKHLCGIDIWIGKKSSKLKHLHCILCRIDIGIGNWKKSSKLKYLNSLLSNPWKNVIKYWLLKIVCTSSGLWTHVCMSDSDSTLCLETYFSCYPSEELPDKL